MKTKKSIIAVLIALLVVAGIEGMVAFWTNHSYYAGMIFSRRNFALLVSAALCARIPLSFITSKKKLTLKRLAIGVGLGLTGFSVLHGLFTKSILTLFAVIPLMFNTLLLYFLAIGTLLAIMAGGNWLVRKLKIFKTIRWQETLLTFGLGLGIFLVLIQLLMGLQIFYSVIVWIIFLGLLVLARFERKQLNIHQESLLGVITARKETKKSSKIGRIMTALLLFSFGYYFFSFSHSYIPYSTAWDANHEYLYTPKVIAENAGILRGNLGAASGMPFLWHGFIAFAFSLWAPLGSVLNIAKDTVAVNLNAISGILVLIFGLGTIKEALVAFKRKKDELSENKNLTPFLSGRGLLLMRLTSGMGAFLIFVDNKTDMGVLALTTLAILAGMVFFNHFQKKREHTEDRQSLLYLIVSALLFAFAVMAKPTAFIDVVMFALLLVGFWLNTTTLVGTGIATLGLMGIIQPLFTSAFIDPTLGKLIFIVGVGIMLIGILRGLIWKSAHFSKSFKHIVIWGITFIASLFLFKGPRVAVSKLTEGDFQFGTFVKSTILGQASASQKEKKFHPDPSMADAKPQLFLAQTQGFDTLQAQSTLDQQTLNEATKDLGYADCLKEPNDPQELNSTKQQAPGSAINEDVGRYVGYAWREFRKTGFGGALLKLMFRKNNACFGRDADGVLLCKQRENLEKKQISALQSLLPQLKKEGTAYQLLESLLKAKETGDDMRDEYKALETYYQEHSIETTDTSVFIPYRYIVPLNIVFNWSLQNLSSYYTDIGLIWLCVFIMMMGGVVYAVISYDKQHKQLLFLTFGTIIGRAIWWAIGGGIVRYGLGLILWSILVLVAFLQELGSSENTSLKARYGWLVGLLAFYIAVQALFNATRIASQASEGPFGQYKANVGQQQRITDTLEFTNKIVYNFNAKDIFDLQFGQYQPFIDAVQERKDEEGVLIAGTYLQYFLKNQKNLRMDGMLTRLREEMSDFNSCRSYQRLKNEKLKYLVIDPNIGTVGRAGEGNESLFYRFFARLTSDEKQIETQGAITMLLKLSQEGYLNLLYTNNLGAKYAFTLSDAQLTKAFGLQSKEELILLRSKMAVAKFFTKEPNLLEQIFMLFQERIANGKGLGDIANILGKQIDETKLLPFVESYLAGNPKKLTDFSQEERFILAQYLGLYNLLASSEKTQAQAALGQLFQTSLFGSSQIISLALK